MENYLQDFHPKMEHIISQVAEKIGRRFPKMYELVLNMKKIFLKTPKLIDLLKIKAPCISITSITYINEMRCMDLWLQIWNQ